MNWYYALGDQRQGPIPDTELDALIAAGTITEDTLVWREGMSDWTALRIARPPGQGAPPPGPGQEAPAGWIRCTATGRYFPPEEIVYLDGKPYSAAAKAGVLQGVMQGGSLPDEGDLNRGGPPWENRQQLGIPKAAWETVKAVLFNPFETFDNMKRTGGLDNPLLYMIITASLGTVCGMIWNWLGQMMFQSFLPTNTHQSTFAFQSAIGGGMILVALILAPIGSAIAAFCGSGILHLSLMICGGAKQPFETTFRAYCYTVGSIYTLQIIPFQVIPIVGPLIGGSVVWVWALVTKCISFARTHEIGTGRAVLAVLLPSILCCGGLIFLAITFAGAIAAAKGIHH